eukprot:COSAG06_NODE_4170_length_4504_cov_4.874007_1_plen_75_part_10
MRSSAAAWEGSFGATILSDPGRWYRVAPLPFDLIDLIDQICRSIAGAAVAGGHRRPYGHRTGPGRCGSVALSEDT